jgi:Ser/Thr protein kinase RdoA (MazF antagonist)
MTMEGQTIKTLAEYIAKLHGAGRNLEHPELYQDQVVDTNGVEQDHINTFLPSEVSSRAD